MATVQSLACIAFRPKALDVHTYTLTMKCYAKWPNVNKNFLPLKIVEPIILIEDQLKKKFKLLHTLHILSIKSLRIENYILRLAICGWWWLLKVKKSHKHFFYSTTF